MSLFSRKTKIEKAVNSAVAWIGTEGNYLEELRQDLVQLSKIMGEEIFRKKEPGMFTLEQNHFNRIKKLCDDLPRISKIASRSERRVNQKEQIVEKEIDNLSSKFTLSANTIHENERLKQKIHMEAEAVLRETSLYEGEIKKHIDKLKEELEVFDNLYSVARERLRDINWRTEMAPVMLRQVPPKVKITRDTPAHERDLHLVLEKKAIRQLEVLENHINVIIGLVRRTMEWLNALTIDLNKAKKVSSDIRMVYEIKKAA